MSAEGYYKHLSDDLYQQERERVTQRSKILVGNVIERVQLLKGATRLLARDEKIVRQLLRFGSQSRTSRLKVEYRKTLWIHDKSLNELNQYLGFAASDYGADLIDVINADGYCIASSNADKPVSPIGISYADREYFKHTKPGEVSLQYAMGKTTHVSGMYFSIPLMQSDRLLGFIVVKRDLAKVAGWIDHASSFISDHNGVIILASDKQLEFHTLPNSLIAQIRTEDIIAQYGRNVLSPLQLSSWGGFDSVFLINNEATPQLIQSNILPDEAITINLLRTLPEINRINSERIWLFIILIFSGFMFIFAASAMMIYWIESRKSRAEKIIAASVLVESNQKMSSLLDSMAEGAYGTDIDGNCIFANQAFLHILGYDNTDEVLGKHIHELIHHSHADGSYYPATECKMYLAFRENLNVHAADEVFWRKDGTPVAVEYWSRPITLNSKTIGAIATFIDITERFETEKELKIAATAFESKEGILITDANKVILRINHAFSEITGYVSDDIVGKEPKVLSSGRHDENFYAEMWNCINNNGVWEGEIWNRRKNGDIYPEYLTISSVKDDNGNVMNYVASFSDLSSKKHQESELIRLAHYDALTHLPNRHLLNIRMHEAMSSGTKTGKYGALISLDLDNFKRLNDIYGHSTGDKLLVQVAKRLTTSVQEGDTVARSSGDTFVVVLKQLNSNIEEATNQAHLTAKKIHRELCCPYPLENAEYHITSSIGLVVFRGHLDTQEDLLSHVDAAMFQAKAMGRNTICFYDSVLQEAMEEHTQLELALRGAVENNELQLYYQLQVDHLDHVLGAEALLRWTHPEIGQISPAQFIPIAEETGLILAIGNWVLETACEQLVKWQKDRLTAKLVMSVNISAKQFKQSNFIEEVQTLFTKSGIDPNLLKFELTESMLLEDFDLIIDKMKLLKGMGVRFSLDDFGTGYSSLQYLKRLPLDQLKIDQSFVRDIAIDSSDKAIVSTIIAMAQSLNLDVIAEGVETEAQRHFLLSSHCNHFQGYLFGKPIPIDEFEKGLKKLVG